VCLGIVATGVCAFAQGTFQNLDFEQASTEPVSPGSPLIWTTNAFPGWTVYANGTPQPFVSYGEIYAPSVAGIMDSNLPGNLVLNGRFSASLGGSGLLNGITASIGQSGVIPTGSESLRLLALGGFLVSFAGHPVPLQFLASGPGGGAFYGADISAYAGQYGQLTFQTGPSSSVGVNLLDDISFSTLPIPEPGVFSIIALGASILSLRRRRHRARSATTH
jgi:hypothetical protein